MLETFSSINAACFQFSVGLSILPPDSAVDLMMALPTLHFKILTFCLLNNILQKQVESLQSCLNSKFQFKNFVQHSFHYLNATRISDEFPVQNFDECCFKCVQDSTCLSVNVASSFDKSKLFWCEMMASDKYVSSKSFQENSISHHFSIMVSKETR